MMVVSLVPLLPESFGCLKSLAKMRVVVGAVVTVLLRMKLRLRLVVRGRSRPEQAAEEPPVGCSITVALLHLRDVPHCVVPYHSCDKRDYQLWCIWNTRVAISVRENNMHEQKTIGTPADVRIVFIYLKLNLCSTSISSTSNLS